jgi:hypothetical protein
MALDLDILAAIDARVRQGERDILAFGTVASVDSDNDVTVTFDGSAASIPCKNFGNVLTIAGDRVGLAKIGKWWTVVGEMERRWPATAAGQASGPGGGLSTASGSYSDTPGLVTLTITKRYDDTQLYVVMAIDTYVSVNGTQFEYGVQIAGVAMAAADYRMGAYLQNFANDHRAITDFRCISGLPADTYTIKSRWKRLAGTGNVTQDNSSDTSLFAQEVSP